MSRVFADSVVWLVRVDASIDPVTEVSAKDWYAARELAASKLQVDKSRLFVSRKSYAFVQ